MRIRRKDHPRMERLVIDEGKDYYIVTIGEGFGAYAERKDDWEPVPDALYDGEETVRPM